METMQQQQQQQQKTKGWRTWRRTLEVSWQPGQRAARYQGVHFNSLFAEATVRSIKRTPRAPSSTRG